jgi:MSHA biogenesis protein MshN
MSLINKMLQDLDARGANPASSVDQEVRLTPKPERPIALPLALGALIVVLVAAALAWYFSVRKAPSPALGSALSVVLPASPAPAPAALPALPAAPPVVLAAPPVVQAAPTVTPVAQAFPSPEPAPVAPVIVAAASPVSERSRVERMATDDQPAPPGARASQRKIAEVSDVRRAGVPPGKSSNEAVAGAPRKQENPRQQAQNAYIRALNLLQDGRVSAAIDGFEQVLRIDPHHDAARQTLIGLLLENKQQDAAMQQLAQALALDPEQPTLAMALARLQVEKGGPALQTLQRTLPYATERADYLSFVAALLQRAQRHKEAIEHYQAAVRLSPGNGLWWMGLGISLQADDRLSDAKAAFQKAKASGSLSGELSRFVDKKLQQLER